MDRIPLNPKSDGINDVIIDDDYVKRKLEQFKESHKNKYKEEYLLAELAKYEKSLRSQQRRFENYFNPLIEQFASGTRRFERCLYGPDKYDDPIETKAWAAFRHVIESKMYKWSSYESVREISDFMEGRCRECTEYIRIS